MNKEMINHPLHYNVGHYEVIDVIEDQGWGEGFNRGNALKYIMRAKHKNADKEIEDLEKARWYIDREISRLKTKTNTDLIQYIKEKYCSQNRPISKENNNLDNERIWENGVEIK